jgi:hypothetical protein
MFVLVQLFLLNLTLTGKPWNLSTSVNVLHLGRLWPYSLILNLTRNVFHGLILASSSSDTEKSFKRLILLSIVLFNFGK